MTPEEKTLFLAGKECPSCHGKESCTVKLQCKDCGDSEIDAASETFHCKYARIKRPFRAELASALGSILGDDTDGLAAEMEDAEALLGKEFWE
jgi:hypothetical protein